MTEHIEEVLATLDGFRMSDEMTYSAYSALYDQISLLDDLLKEHEPVKPKSKVRHGAYGQIQHFCGNCNAMLHGKQKYCSECGKEVKWDG